MGTLRLSWKPSPPYASRNTGHFATSQFMLQSSLTYVPARIELLPIDADEFLSEIQAQIDASKSVAAGRTSAVQFFPPLALDGSSEQIPEIPSEENFCKHDYVFSNPDIPAAVRQREFRSGFEHWIGVGQ
jgi:hypothetical protein